MKNVIALCLFLIVSVVSIYIGSNVDYTVTVANPDNNTPSYRKVWNMYNLGTPSAVTFDDKKLTSRNPWDMKVFNGKLYVGSGDWNENTGPVTVWHYNIENSIWENTGTINDDAITRFHVLNDKLVISGTDPKEDHSLGNYYVLNDDKWDTVRTIPNGVHLFDIAEYKNETFYAIGTPDNTTSPVQKTADGQTFVNILFFNGDEQVLGDKTLQFSRCYALFKADNGLFAFCRWNMGGAYGFYEYKNGAFYLIENITKISAKYPGINRQQLLNEWLTVNDTCYISLGNVYSTKDFKTLETLKTPDDEYVQDITEHNGKVYMISSKKIEIMPEITNESETPPTPIIKYKNTVWEYSETDGFKEVFSFNYNSTAMSFVFDDDRCYVGIGSFNDQTIKQTYNGTILMFKEELVEVK